MVFAEIGNARTYLPLNTRVTYLYSAFRHEEECVRAINKRILHTIKLPDIYEVFFNSDYKTIQITKTKNYFLKTYRQNFLVTYHSLNLVFVCYESLDMV